MFLSGEKMLLVEGMGRMENVHFRVTCDIEISQYLDLSSSGLLVDPGTQSFLHHDCGCEVFLIEV